MSIPSVSDREPKPVVIKKFSRLPSLLLKKDKVTVIKSENADIIKNISLTSLKQFYKEDLIYNSRPGDFLNSTDSITLSNQHNLTTNSVRTVARYVSHDGKNSFVKSSDNVVKVIGQDNYDILFSALCSVLNLELKVRGILALQTLAKATHEAASQTQSGVFYKSVSTLSTATQTEESSMDMLLIPKKRKRIKRQQVKPYVVKNVPEVPKKMVKKIIINPENFSEFRTDEDFNTITDDMDRKKEGQLPEIHLDEDSNVSCNMSALSVDIPQLLENPTSLLHNAIEKHTIKETVHEDLKANVSPVNLTKLTLIDGTQITIPVKPEDQFHIATPDILKHVSVEHRRKLLFLQAYLDWKHCTDKDEDGYMPLHLAAQNGDVDLIRRQCLVLKTQNVSVDVTAGNMTALQLSLYQPSVQCTTMLLQFGADPLITDVENRTCFHLAAEERTDHLRAIINYCHANPMRILRENEEFWRPELESKPKDVVTQYLFDKLSQIHDSQGDTPLMVASKIGNYEAVQALVEMAPASVNLQQPNSGNTALYLAVGAACLDSTERGNMTKVSDNFLKTIDILVSNGADPAIDNYSGVNVNVLLTEFNIGELSLLIANKLTSINCFNGAWTPDTKPIVMLVKDKEGKVNVEEIKERKDFRRDNKPKILENTLIMTKDTKQDGDSNFINTFKRFLEKKDTLVDLDTPIPITVENTFVPNKFKVVKKKISPKKVNATTITRANLVKIKEQFDFSVKSNNDSQTKDTNSDCKDFVKKTVDCRVLEPMATTSAKDVIIGKSEFHNLTAKKRTVPPIIANSKRRKSVDID